MNTRTIATASFAAIAAGALLLTGCSSGAGGGSGAQGDELEGLTGEIGSKDFSEQYILAYMTAELLNAHGADVEAKHAPERPGEQKRSAVDVRKAQRVLGWQPKMSLRDGLTETYRYFAARRAEART